MSVFLLSVLLLLAEGCTLTASEAHGVRFCPLAVVVQDMKERNLEYNAQGSRIAA